MPHHQRTATASLRIEGEVRMGRRNAAAFRLLAFGVAILFGGCCLKVIRTASGNPFHGQKKLYAVVDFSSATIAGKSEEDWIAAQPESERDAFRRDWNDDKKAASVALVA